MITNSEKLFDLASGSELSAHRLLGDLENEFESWKPLKDESICDVEGDFFQPQESSWYNVIKNHVHSQPDIPGFRKSSENVRYNSFSPSEQFSSNFSLPQVKGSVHSYLKSLRYKTKYNVNQGWTLAKGWSNRPKVPDDVMDSKIDRDIELTVNRLSKSQSNYVKKQAFGSYSFRPAPEKWPERKRKQNSEMLPVVAEVDALKSPGPRYNLMPDYDMCCERSFFNTHGCSLPSKCAEDSVNRKVSREGLSCTSTCRDIIFRDRSDDNRDACAVSPLEDIRLSSHSFGEKKSVFRHQSPSTRVATSYRSYRGSIYPNVRPQTKYDTSIEKYTLLSTSGENLSANFGKIDCSRTTARVNAVRRCVNPVAHLHDILNGLEPETYLKTTNEFASIRNKSMRKLQSQRKKSIFSPKLGI